VRNSDRTFADYRRFARLSPALVLAIAFLLLLAPNVRAHARLESSSISPGAILSSVPATVTLDFSEPVDVDYSTASLIDATGQTVSSITLAVDSASPRRAMLTIVDTALPAGAYAIVWRVLSAADGHATTGSLAFSAGTGAAPTIASTTSAVSAPWATVTARWLELVGMLAIAGSLLFAALVPGSVRLQRTFTIALHQIVLVAGALGLAGAAVSSLANAIAANDRSWGNLPSGREWWDALAGTDLGRAIAIRAVVFTVALVLASVLRLRGNRWVIWVASVAAVAALASFPLTGHARAASPRWLAVALDLAHLASAALWGGGIALLGLFLFRQLADRERATIDTAIAAIARFSRCALLAMILLVGSGIVSAAFHVSGPKNLTGESYGRTLILKVMLVVLVLVVAGTNRLFIIPRLRAAQGSNRENAFGQSERIRQTALLEAVAALLILFAAARLTELPPADGPLTVDVAGRQGAISEQAAAGDLTIALTGQLDPAAGESLTITVTDAGNDEPASDLARVIVLATAPDPLAPDGDPIRDRFDAIAVDGAPGVYAFPRTRLGIQTTWQIEIAARRLGMPDANATFNLDLTAVGAQPPRLVDDHWRRPTLPWTGWLALAAAAATFAGGIVLLRRLKGLEPVTGGIFLAVIVLISSAFALSAYRSGPIPTNGHSLQNPASAADSSLLQPASDLFAAQCASCHGAAGQGTDNGEHGHGGGDRDLTAGQTQQMSDGDLYTVITDGIGGTEMPAFGLAFTDEQRWTLVNLIREYQEQAEEAP
jgi:copper transport protein